MERLARRAWGCNGRQRRKDSPKGGTQTKDRAGLLLAFLPEVGTVVWFLMASKLPPKPLNSPGTTRMLVSGAGAVCQGGGAAGRDAPGASQAGCRQP